jgi:hypothetical protein
LLIAAAAILLAGGPPGAAAAPTLAIDLRTTLGRALAEHTYLAMEAMRAVVAGTPDEAALVVALDDNATALETAFGGVYGQARGREFGRLWRIHIDGLVDYAVARDADDEAAAEAALASLATYRRDFGHFLASTDPTLGTEHEALALQLHIDQLIAFADADYERAFQAERVAYRHMFELGDTLASAITDRFPKRFPGARVAFSPSGELRMDLSRLLGEHLILAAQAMRSAIDGTPDFEAARAAIDENTAELGTLIARVYGSAAGDSFAELWGRHIEAYVAYIGAVVDGDAGRQETVLETLRAYPNQIAGFLTAANPKFSADAVARLVGHHVDALILVVDTYSAGDAAASVQAVRAAHGHMFQVAAALTRGIIDQFPNRYADLDRLPATDAEVEIGSAIDPARVVLGVLLAGSIIAVIVLSAALRGAAHRRA